MFAPVSFQRPARWIATLAAALLLMPAAWSQANKPGNKKNNAPEKSKTGPTNKSGADNMKADTNPRESPLADVFAGDDGGAYYVTEKGTQVYWFAEHPGRDYAHVFKGTRAGSVITGKYWSVPKDKATAHGTVTFKVNANGSLTRTHHTDDFPSKSFSVTTIDHITKKLPGSKGHPGFTRNTLADLDGLFKDDKDYHYYVRQLGDTVVFVAEPKFSTGTRPEGVYLFIGQRSGNGIEGQIVASPKGKAKGANGMQLSLKPDRTLVKSGGIPFGGGPLLPVLPDIKVPISKVMDLLNSQMNKVRVRLDGYDTNGESLPNGSFVKLGDKELAKFSLPYLEVKLAKSKRRTFINDMESDIVHLKPLSANSTRLSIIFETHGKEIKRYAKNSVFNDDDLLSDWQIENPRVDITFKLINYKTKEGQPSISFEVTDVDVHGKLDAKLLGDGIENFISGLIRPEVEKQLKKGFNNQNVQQNVANTIYDKLVKLSDYLEKYQAYGYSLSDIAPKSVVIEGSNLVFKFK
jgi:hypothetical protein